jgi:SAM-dependent methyltransferase
MKNRTKWKPTGDMRLIHPYLPGDTSEQYHAFKEALRAIRGESVSATERFKILDLGCGKGDSCEDFMRTGHPVEWLGLDIEDSPEAKGSGDRHGRVHVYDGIHIPFEDATFDMVYSRQAFEHVLFPRELLSDVLRVLRNGGVFAGSCSALEPFHSRSICNFTPYGFCTLLASAGFRGIHVRPGIDGLSLIARKLLAFAGISMGSWFFVHESPLNMLLEAATRILGFETRRRAAIKLLFSGHFVFSAMKVS